MKKVIIDKEEKKHINLSNVPEYTPIFAKDKKTGKLKGMLIKNDGGKWIVSIGSDFGSSGAYETREECLSHDSEFHDFFVEE